MSLKDLKFELTPEQKEKRHQLALDLQKEPEIAQFLEEQGCPFEVYEYHISKFKRWLYESRLAHSYSEKEIEKDLSKGQYIDLYYDKDLNTIFEVVRKLPIVYELEKKAEFLKQYEVFPLAKSLHHAMFEKIDIEAQSPAYIKVMKSLIDFIDDDQTGYYLYGDFGVGKSFLSACVTNKFADQRKRVAFIHVPSFLNHLKQQFSNQYGVESDLKRLRTVDCLVLDDLGAEPITPWARDEILLSILNERLENERKTIITSNYQPEQLQQLYQLDTKGVSDAIRAKRLVDRIRALTKPQELIGKNRRYQ